MRDQRVIWRFRSAAIVAAAALSLAAGGMMVAQAAPGPSESTTVMVTPERILDTRDPVNVGLAGPFVSAVSQKLQVTGPVPTTTGTKTVAPTGATGVLLNVTPVNASASGFISIRPGDATGAATTSSLNFTRGDILPNAVQVALPTAGANAGKIDITYDAYGASGPTTDILIDVVGYTTSTGLQELVADVAAKANSSDVNAALATKASARCSATLRWDLTACKAANLALPAGAGSPRDVAFDGTNIWTANFANNNVTRINTTTGAATNFALPAGAGAPIGVVFDGTNIWTANNQTANVTRINMTSGAGTNFALPAGAAESSGVVFDGTNIWTANSITGNVTRINAATGSATNFALPGGASTPGAAAFDGANIWTANNGTNNVTRIDVATGAGVNFPLPAGVTTPQGLAFDGVSIWTGTVGSLATRFNVATGAGTNVPLPDGANNPVAVVFDGANIWTANGNSANVSRLVP
jgi:streptogramin lyase